MKDPKDLKEVINAILVYKGYMDINDNKLHPEEDFLGICKCRNGYFGILVKDLDEAIKSVQIRENGTIYRSQLSISGVFGNRNINKREDWEDFNRCIVGKVSEVLLKNGKYFNFT